MNHKEEIALLIKRNAWERAEQLCQSEILNHPTDPATWFYLGAVQSAQGRRVEAIRSLKAAASYVADDVSVIEKPKRPGSSGQGDGNDSADITESLLLKIAQALLRLRAYEAAAPVYQRLDFSLPPVVLGLGRCYWGVGRYKEALHLFNGLWQARPQWAELGLTYARALSSVDANSKAKNILTALYKLYPQEPGVLHQYALFLLSKHGLKESAQWLQQQQSSLSHSKLALLRAALYQQADINIPGALHVVPSNEREISQWESYQYLAEQNSSTRWFGDNTALLKYATSLIPAEGDVVECGVFHGRSLNLLAHWTSRPCHGFDSFQGLPEAWSLQEPAGAYSTGGTKPMLLADHITLHEGWFEDSLPEFSKARQEPIALLHIDCDLYSSTKTVLNYLLPHLQPGSLIVFDDFAGYPEWRQHEYKAWQEVLTDKSINVTLEAAVMLGRSVAFRVN